MTDYQAELQRIEADLRTVRSARGDAVLSPDAGGVVRLLYLRFQHASLTGELAPLRELDELLDAAIAASAHPADLWLLKAHIALKRHRFTEAEAALRADPSLANSALARLLQADIDLQQGRYLAARKSIEAVMAEDPTWDALARLAHLTALMGDLQTADELYATAEDELTAKQMQTYAWLEVQRGWMHFQRGNQPRARRHYERADAAYSGYWLVAERMAELIGAQGHFDEAIAAYRQLNAASPRLVWEHALGDLYSLSGDAQQAHESKLRAHAGYIESVAGGESFFYHYLVDLCCELPGHQHEAIEWARKDLAMRDNFMTQGDLAWALYRGGNLAEAVEYIDQALASGAVCARLYTQAACIYSAAKRPGLGAQNMRLALATNPYPPRARIQHGNATRSRETTQPVPVLPLQARGPG